MSNAGLDNIRTLANLHELCLRGTGVVGGRLPCLEHLPRLGVADFAATGVDDAGLESLRTATNLSKLKLAGTKVSDAGLEHLAALPNLTAIDLSGTQVAGPGLRYLKKSAPVLRILDLSSTPITDAGLECVLGLPMLQVLGLAHTAVTDAGMRHIDALPHLLAADLRGTRVAPGDWRSSRRRTNSPGMNRRPTGCGFPERSGPPQKGTGTVAGRCFSVAERLLGDGASPLLLSRPCGLEMILALQLRPVFRRVLPHVHNG